MNIKKKCKILEKGRIKKKQRELNKEEEKLEERKNEKKLKGDVDFKAFQDDR